MSVEKPREVPASVGLPVVGEPCGFTRAELTNFLEKSDFGQNATVFAVMLESSPEGPLCRNCHRSIGSHGNNAEPTSNSKNKEEDDADVTPEPDTGLHYPEDLAWTTSYDVLTHGTTLLQRASYGCLCFFVAMYVALFALERPLLALLILGVGGIVGGLIVFGFARTTTFVIHKTDSPPTVEVSLAGRWRIRRFMIELSELSPAYVVESRGCFSDTTVIGRVVVDAPQRRGIQMFKRDAVAAHAFVKKWKKYVEVLTQAGDTGVEGIAMVDASEGASEDVPLV